MSKVGSVRSCTVLRLAGDGDDPADEPGAGDHRHAHGDAVVGALVDLDGVLEVGERAADHPGDRRVGMSVQRLDVLELGELAASRLDVGRLGGVALDLGDLLAQPLVLVARGRRSRRPRSRRR